MIVYEEEVEWHGVQEQLRRFSDKGPQISSQAQKAIREDEDDIEVDLAEKVKLKVKTGEIQLESADVKDKPLNAKVSRAQLKIEKSLGVRYVGRQARDDRSPSKKCPACGSHFRVIPMVSSRGGGERYELQCPHPRCRQHVVLTRGRGRTIARNLRTGAVVKL
jgi:hypothetical protein